MDRTLARPVFISLLALALAFGMIFLSFQNRSLRSDNEALRGSSADLQVKIDKLMARNSELQKVIAENHALVKSVEKQKKSLKETMASVKKENESIQYEMKKAEAQMNTALEEKTYLEDMLIHKTREIESLKTNSSGTNAAQTADAVTSATADTSDIAAKIKQKEDDIQRLNQQNHILSEKMDRLYQVTTSKISEINVAKIALEDTVTGAKDKIDEEWNTVDLGSISVDKKENTGSPEQANTEAPRKEKPSGPKTQGKVLAINEDHGFVVVDLGKVDNMSANTSLLILHDGKNIANLSVLEIRDVMTACNIKNLEDGQKIRINDAVLVQK